MDKSLQSIVVKILQDGNTEFCNYCLRNNKELHYTRANEDISDVNLSAQVSETFGFQIAEDLISDYICSDCKQIIQHAYNFITRVKNTRKILASYLTSLDSKIATYSTNLNNAKHNFSNIIIKLDDEVSKECNMLLFQEEILVIKSDAARTETDNKANVTDLLQFKSVNSAIKAVCKYCFKIFDKQTLRSHLKEEHIKEIVNINCSECLNAPCCHTKYLEHIKMLRQTGDFKLTCIDCQQFFKHKHLLISHINSSHLNISPFLCDVCGASFTSIENQICHKMNQHSVKKECQFCDSNFKSKIDLDCHELNCLKKKGQFYCEKCSVSFSTSDKLIIHINNHHIKHKCNELTEACGTMHLQDKNLCKKEQEIPHSKQAKKRNKNRIAKKKKGKYKIRSCYLCTDQFESLKELVSHLQAKHRPDELYKCQLCQKAYESRNNFLCHIKSSTHLRKADPNFKPNFKCSDCDISYSTMLLLERHRNARHLKILPFTCEKCGKAFAAKSNLKLHLTRHSKQRNYQCNFCSALFTEPTGLKSHILRQHAPEKKKFACELCGKTFISMSECKVHQLRQHSEKNFSCPLCDGKYHTNPNLRGHIKKVHLRNISLTEYMNENGFSKDLQEVFRDRRAPCVVET